LEAVMNRPTTLEQTIAATFANENAGSELLVELIREVEQAAAAAEQTAKQEHAKAIDLIASPDPKAAHERVVESEIFRDRLHHAIPRLRDKLTVALAAEAKERWWADYQRAKAKRDEAADMFAEYPELAARLVEIFRTAQAVDKEVSRLNGVAPVGEHRRLKPVELEARGLENYSRDTPSLAKMLRLPDPEQPGKFVWPPRERSLAVQVATSTTYSHSSGDWWQDSKQRASSLREEHASVVDHYDSQARAREERENAEAASVAAARRNRS
jgi:adenylate kinase family enzyme